jgi:hypothetical protein
LVPSAAAIEAFCMVPRAIRPSRVKRSTSQPAISRIAATRIRKIS